MVAAARAKRIKEVEASIARVTARKQVGCHQLMHHLIATSSLCFARACFSTCSLPHLLCGQQDSHQHLMHALTLDPWVAPLPTPQGASLEDDEAEYRRLQKEGFFAGGGNKGGAKSSTGTAPPAPATTTTTSGAATAPASQGQPAQPAPAPAQPAPKSKKKKAEAAAAAAAGGADGQKAADGAPAAEGGGEGGGGEGEGAKKVKKPAKPKAAPGEPKEGDRRIRRLITWTAPDGTQRSREVIYTDKNGGCRG
jgi:hypothetical protein